MKSFRVSASVLCLAVGWTAQAVAQSGGYGAPTLLPLPSSAGQSWAQASYTSNHGFTPLPSTQTGRQEALPEPSLAPPAGQTDFERALKNNSDWAPCGECCEPNRGHCFGYVGGLVMGRNRANPFWTSYQTNVNDNQVLNTQNAVADWAGGGQVTLGYAFAGCGGCSPCDCGPCGPLGYGGPAIAFTYWGLGPMNGFADIQSPTNELSTPINLQTQFGDVMIGSQPASDFFDNSSEHRISRTDRVNNYELNVIQGGWNMGRCQLAALGGFRYFRFDEALSFTGTAGGGDPDDPADNATLRSRCVNNLFGGQIGAIGNYMITERWGIFAVPKVGIFYNQMNGRTQLYSDDIVAYNIMAHKSDVSLLGEIDVGFNYALTQHLKAYIGYRVLGITNVALSDNQFLPYLADEKGFTELKQSGSVILHGAFAGLGWNF